MGVNYNRITFNIVRMAGQSFASSGAVLPCRSAPIAL